MLALLVEMSGRLGAVSKRSLAAAVRERFGVPFQFVPLAAELLLDTCLLAAEIGGVAIAVHLLTGTTFQWWILPVGLAVWLLLWWGSFAIIEHGVGLLGLVTLAFVVSAWQLGPRTSDLAASLIPSWPTHDHTRYAFIAVSILGATVSPYLLNFYASGTVEEKMEERDLWANSTTAYLGIPFGGVVSMGVLVTSAMVFGPTQVKIESYDQAALMFVPVFQQWAVPLFALALGVGCFGAAVEIALNAGYAVAQVFGWPWGANKPRRDAPRFAAAITVVLLIALLIAVTGVDPLQLTLLSVALTVVIMPAVVLPFLVLMNDPRYVGEHRSGVAGNLFLAVLKILACVLALVVIPLELLGG